MEKVIIVGGDKVAYHLIGILKKEHLYEIHVIDLNRSACEKLANTYNIKTYCGDGTNLETLRRAGIEGANIFIALTGQDENNLIACQIAKLRFDIPYTIAKANNPRNSNLMKLLGVDQIFSATDMIAQMIQQEVAYSGMSLVYSFEGNTKMIVRAPLNPNSKACGKTLQEYDFVEDCRVVMVIHSNGQAEIAYGDLRMEVGDTLLMVCDQRDLEEIWLTIVRPELNAAKTQEKDKTN